MKPLKTQSRRDKEDKEGRNEKDAKSLITKCQPSHTRPATVKMSVGSINWDSFTMIEAPNIDTNKTMRKLRGDKQ